MYVRRRAHVSIIGQRKSGGGGFAIFDFHFVFLCNAHVLQLSHEKGSVDSWLHEVFNGVSLSSTNADSVVDRRKAGSVDLED